jgi:hypothetical protein
VHAAPCCCCAPAGRLRHPRCLSCCQLVSRMPMLTHAAGRCPSAAAALTAPSAARNPAGQHSAVSPQQTQLP